MPDLHIGQEIDKEGKFIVSGGLPNAKVSWTVYGERNDEYLLNRSYLTIPEVLKTEEGQGKYFHPEDYNLGEELRFIQE